MAASRTAIWLTAAALVARCASATPAELLTGVLGPPEPLGATLADVAYPFRTHVAPVRPHPAVARIVVPEGNDATSYGSGTLVDVRDQFGLVVTNWHVVRDGTGDVEVIFPDGFRSKARPLKVDADWDLAALVIWRPLAAPVTIAAAAPQPGDQLTICGYGSGQYRAATGRCTQYYSPAVNLPQHMVELDVEARQGDSGGPIFNDRGELAGVLFGAGRGTTLGSFGGRVGSFLATLAPNIGRAAESALAQSHAAAPNVGGNAIDHVNNQTTASIAASSSHIPVADSGAATSRGVAEPPHGHPASLSIAADMHSLANDHGWQSVTAGQVETTPATRPATSSGTLFAHTKNVLAVVGALALLFLVLRLVR